MGVAVLAVSLLIGLVATVLIRRDGGPTILLPLLLLPTFVLLLIRTRRAARGQAVEDPAEARLAGWLVPLATAVIVAGLMAQDLAWLLGRMKG